MLMFGVISVIFSIVGAVNMSYTQYDRMDRLERYINTTEYKDVSRSIVAMGVLESGWYKLDHKWYTKGEIGGELLVSFFKDKGYPTDVKGFLARVGGKGGVPYAKDPKYVSKIKKIIRMLDNIDYKAMFKSWES